MGINFFFLTFQIFFGVCLFGLFHGLVFLPVFLSILGPKPYQNVFKKYQNDDIIELKDNSTKLLNALSDDASPSSIICDTDDASNDVKTRGLPVRHSDV